MFRGNLKCIKKLFFNLYPLKEDFLQLFYTLCNYLKEKKDRGSTTSIFPIFAVTV